MIFSQYFFLGSGKIIVHGVKHSVLLDLKDCKIYSLNPLARHILDLGERGLNIKEVIEKLNSELEASGVIDFLNELLDHDMIQLSNEPKQENLQTSPLPKLDFLWIEVTSHCNLHCIHCYADSEAIEVEQPSSLSIEELKKVIDEAARLNCRKVQLTGGEPTLIEDLKELIKHAKAKGFEFIEVFTNGTLLTESMVGFLAEENIHVAMSLYSYKADTHDAITRVPGSFEKTMNSLKLLLAYGVMTRCAVIAMKLNLDDLDGTCYLLSQLGVFFMPPDPIRPTGRGKSMENWSHRYYQNSMLTCPSFFISSDTYERNHRWNSCWFGKAAVTSNGDVIPCVFARDHVTSNIKRQSLSEIVFGKEMLSLWSITKDKLEICGNCEYRYICGDCRPWAYGFTGNLYAKSPRCCYNPSTGEWMKV